MSESIRPKATMNLTLGEAAMFMASVAELTSQRTTLIGIIIGKYVCKCCSQ